MQNTHTTCGTRNENESKATRNEHEFGTSSEPIAFATICQGAKQKFSQLHCSPALSPPLVHSPALPLRLDCLQQLSLSLSLCTVCASKAPTLYSKMCCGCHVKRARERAPAWERSERERARASLAACVLQFKMSLKSAALHSLIVKRDAKQLSSICLCLNRTLSRPSSLLPHKLRHLPGILQFYRASSYANNNLQEQQQTNARRDDDGASARHDATRTKYEA